MIPHPTTFPSNPSRLLGTALAVFLTLAAGSAGAAPIEITGIKAVVNGEAITQLEVDEAVRTQMKMYIMQNQGQVTPSQAERDIREMEKSALNDLIDRKLILSEFKTMGGSIDEKYVDSAVENFVKSRFDGDRDAFLRELAKQGISLNQFRDVQRDQIAIQALRSRYSNPGGKTMLSLPHERREIYDEIKNEYATEGKLKLRMLSIPKLTPDSSMEAQERLIREIRKSILEGKSFSEMAKRHSQDSFASKGGYVGEIGRGTLNQRLTQIAYSLPTGKVSEVIDDGPSWRLMYIDGRVGQSVPSMADLKDEIEKRLAVKKRQDNMETWLKKLRRDSNVRIYE